MIKKIYKITKPSDPMTVYIGSTKLTLKGRFRKHFDTQKLYSTRTLYKWLDNTCEIEFIEEREADSQKAFEVIEYEWVSKFKDEGYLVLNFNDGRSKASGYTKAMNDKNSARNKASGYTKAYKDNRHPDYCKWQSKICKACKKLGLTSKEYRTKYNIPDYDGPKKIN